MCRALCSSSGHAGCGWPWQASQRAAYHPAMCTAAVQRVQTPRTNAGDSPWHGFFDLADAATLAFPSSSARPGALPASMVRGTLGMCLPAGLGGPPLGPEGTFGVLCPARHNLCTSMPVADDCVKPCTRLHTWQFSALPWFRQVSTPMCVCVCRCHGRAHTCSFM